MCGIIAVVRRRTRPRSRLRSAHLLHGLATATALIRRPPTSMPSALGRGRRKLVEVDLLLRGDAGSDRHARRPGTRPVASRPDWSRSTLQLRHRDACSTSRRRSGSPICEASQRRASIRARTRCGRSNATGSARPVRSRRSSGAEPSSWRPWRRTCQRPPGAVGARPARGAGPRLGRPRRRSCGTTGSTSTDGRRVR